jgi:glycosyltransferase involved in cell wall biosynthesis
MAHDFYRLPGGEDESFRAELAMLQQHGHDVATYTRSNDEIDTPDLISRARLFAETIWSTRSYQEISRLIEEQRPQVAHFQNTFPLISPSAYDACRAHDVPVVQSLRNYRVVCANGLFLRQGRPCEDCLGKVVPWPAVVHTCYRGSRLETTAVAAMLAYHRAVRTWESRVDVYVALTEFGRGKFIEAGIPPEKIIVKPNFLADPGPGPGDGAYALFVGRLSDEKGIRLLLRAWTQLSNVPLRIVGDGPLEAFARGYIEGNKLNAIMLGRLPQGGVMQAIKASAFVVFPSLCYESFGRTIVEAFACGKPVVGTRNGAAEELIEHGATGLHFAWNDPDDLATQVRWLWEHRADLLRMAGRARQEYLLRFTPARNYGSLMAIYDRAVGQHA